VQQFYRFCAAADIEPSFDSYDALTAFCQWYVAGVGDKKLRAHTTLGSYLSAFADHCSDRGLPFAYKDTPLRRRVNRFVQGLKNLYPHEPRRTVALCLDKLGHVAADYGFRTVADLYRRPIQWLSRWARIISAHDGFMRPCEHGKGCRLSDITDCGSYVAMLVGSRPGESKYKNQPRTVVLPVRTSFLSAGFVLRVLVGRLHAAVPAADRGTRILFSAVTDAGGYVNVAEPWQQQALPRLRRFARQCGVVVASGRCLRAGGATDFFARGAPRWWIKRQGGWRGRAVDRYNQPSEQQRHAAAAVYSDGILAAAVAATPRAHRRAA
jgi:hypothetical protein